MFHDDHYRPRPFLHRTRIQLPIVLLVIFASSGCRKASTKDPDSVALTSDAFHQGENIPQQFTCKGTNISPALSWGHLPPGTKSLALVVSDPDSFLGAYVHWVIYDLPPEPDHLAERIPPAETLPDGARQGTNSGDTVGYIGPCPPGRAPHRYVFTLYALDTSLNPPPPAKKQQLMQSMQGHILASGQLMGYFAR